MGYFLALLYLYNGLIRDIRLNKLIKNQQIHHYESLPGTWNHSQSPGSIRAISDTVKDAWAGLGMVSQSATFNLFLT